MSFIRVINDWTRAEIIRAVNDAPGGWRVTLEEPQRTSEQNKLMWALLSKVADQVTHNGRKYPAEIWKCIFMKALGVKVEFVISPLDGEIVALGYRSSKLSRAKMSDMVECIYSEGARLGVDFDKEKAA